MAFQKLHHQVRRSRADDAKVQNGHGVRVPDPASRNAFAPKTGDGVRFEPHARLENLHRNFGLEVDMSCFVDGSKGARTEPLLENVLPDERRARARSRLRPLRFLGTFLTKLGLDARQGHGKVDRLRDVVVGAAFESFHDALGAVIGRRHDDRQVTRRVFLTQRSEHLDPTHPRHHDVEKNEVEILRFDQRQRIPPVLGGLHAIPLADQTLGQHVPVGFVVIDDEQLWLHVVRLPSSRRRSGEIAPF